MKYLPVIFLLGVSNSLVNGYLEWDTEGTPAFDLELYEEVLNPDLCTEQLAYISGDTLLRSKFLDAGIRTPRGITDLNFVDLGNYHQCLGIHDATSSIGGKYCSIQIPLLQHGLEVTENTSLLEKLRDTEALKAYLESLSSLSSNVMIRTDLNTSLLPSLSLTVATCIPKTCSTQQALDSLHFNVTSSGLKYTERFCRLPNDKPFVTADYLAFAIFGLLGILTIASTAYDVHHSAILKKDPKSASTLYQSFSVYTNCRRLVTYTSTPKTIECLDGLRVMSTMWVILGHTYSNGIQNPLSNPVSIYKWVESKYSILISAAPISVDTFFLLSGILVVYTTAGKLKRMNLIKNIHLFYLNRLLRMFPVLAAGVLLTASWLNHIADGPNWQRVTQFTHNCRTFWWSTLLHVHNYMNPKYLCLEHSWYLAVDIQLHLLSPLILFWVLTSRKAAWISLTSALVTSLTAATIFNAVRGFPSALFNPARLGANLDFQRHYYINTLTRAAPFFVGMLFGYLLHTARETKVRIRKTLALLIWTLWITLMALVIYIPYPIQQADWDNRMLDIILNSYMRPAWAVGVGWMIFACAHGYGGPLNWILSLKIWKLPSRLSYAMYIFHHPMIIMINATAIYPVYFTNGLVIFRFFANFSLVLLVAFLVTLLVDVPFSNLIKMAIGGGAKTPNPQNVQETSQASLK